MAEDIKPCGELEEHLAPYVDGEETPAARRAVEAHLAACPPCLERADAERAARDAVHAQRDRLRSAAPAELRARGARPRESCRGHAAVNLQPPATRRVRQGAPL